MHLVHVEISKDNMGCIEAVAQGAKEGHVIGCVISVLYKRRRYGVVICGEAFNDPAWADGVTSVSKAELMDLIRERGQRDTTL